MEFERGERVRGKAGCAGCDAEVDVDTGESPYRLMAEYAAGVLAGDLTAWCDDCEGKAEAAAEQADREELREERLRRSEIPKTLVRSLDDVDAGPEPVRARTVAAAKRWAAGLEPGLLISGEVGVGKTFIAGAAATERAWLSGVLWLPVADLLLGLRSPFDSEAYRRAARRLHCPPGVAVVMDDLDKTARPTETALQPLYALVDKAVTRGQPLLVTMNRSLEEIADDWPVFGRPIASRLEGYCAVAALEGRDRRRDP